MVAVPFALSSGSYAKLPVSSADVYVTVGFGIISVSLLTAETVISCVKSSSPSVIPDKLTVCHPASSFIAPGSSISYISLLVKHLLKLLEKKNIFILKSHLVI